MNVAQAKQLHLKAVLARLGHEPQREEKGELWYVSPFREETVASFKLTRDGKAWYDHGAGQGGNILDFAIQYYQLPANGIRDALKRLDSLFASTPAQRDLYQSTVSVAAKPEPNENPLTLQVDKIQPVQHPALVAYLAQRSIPLGLAQPFVQEMHYRYQEKPYFALAFQNDSGGYELRNPYFKGCYQCKDITRLPLQPSQTVAIFEGFMDFLSALAYASSVSFHQVLVLNSSSMRERAVETIQRFELQQVQLYLDHDAAGQALTTYFQTALMDREVTNQAAFYEGYKDLNEFWVKHQQSKQFP